MPSKYYLPLCAGLALVACGSGDADSEPAAGEPVDATQAARMMEDVVRPEPGQYSSRMEVLDFSISGLPDAEAEQMRSMMGGQQAMESSFCLTPEEAEQGPERMVQEMASADCVFDKFESSGNKLAADMRCTRDGGIEGNYQLRGEMRAQGSDMTMRIDQPIPDIPGKGRMRIEMKLSSSRTGDCA